MNIHHAYDQSNNLSFRPFRLFCGTLSEASDELSTLSSFRLWDPAPLPVITFAADFFLSPACFWVRDFYGIVNSFLLPCLLLPVSVQGDFLLLDFCSGEGKHTSPIKLGG